MKYIKGYERLYSITEDGCVYSHYLKSFLKPVKIRKGYYQIGLSKNGERKFYLIHRLVAETYIPNPNNLPIVNHKDENPKNNSINNLEWCDAKYNVNYGTRNERAAAKISQKNSKAVYCIELNKIFKSQTEAAKELGISQGNISSCCAGKLEKTGGYHFRSMAIEEVKGDK